MKLLNLELAGRMRPALAALAVSAFLLGGSDALADTKIRLMAANITSGNNQSYDGGHGTRIFQGLDPDIVMIQEFNYGDNSPSSIQNYVTSTFGPGWYGRP